MKKSYFHQKLYNKHLIQRIYIQILYLFKLDLSYLFSPKTPMKQRLYGYQGYDIF